MDHVEECPSYYVDCWGTICDCDYEHICMCGELLACEERVLNEYRQQHDGISERYFQQIRKDALDAAEKRHEGELADEWQRGVTAGKVIGRMDAREAVAALTAGRERMDYEDGPEVYGAHNAYIDCVHDALAAIDALRKEDQ